MKGIDYTASTTAAQAKALKDAGYGFVCRYLVPVRMAWKRLTKAEADIISATGLQIVSVYEANANNAAKGAVQGAIDGKEAIIEGNTVCQPQGSTIYFAVDYDVQAKDYDIIEAYLKAAQAQIIGYNVGCYGSFGVCEEMSKRGIKYCWQTYAWSAGKKSTYANVYQFNNGVNICGISCDANESYGNEGFWNFNEKTPSVISTPAVIILKKEEDLMSKLLDELVTQYGEDKIKNAIVSLINKPEIPDWKAQGVNYLKDNGYINHDHVGDELVDFGDFGAMIDNYNKSISTKEISDWAKPSMDKAVQLGIIKGDGTGYKPCDFITREETVVTFDRMGLLK